MNQKITHLTITILLLLMSTFNVARAEDGSETTAISWLSEDFENGTPEGWDIGMFYMASGGVNGSRAMWSESFIGDDALTTPAVKMGSNPTFSFDYKVNGTKFGIPDAYAADPANVKFRIEVSEDNGATWQTVYRIQPDGGDMRHVMSNDFAHLSIDLPQYAGKTCRIKIAIDKYFLTDDMSYCVYIIDNVQGGTPPSTDLQISDLSIPSFLKTGEETTFNVTITNYGVTAIDNYTVTLADHDGNTLTTSGILSIEPSAKVTETLKWAPSQSGIFYVSATANIDNDTNPANNTTAESAVRVYSTPTETLTMGQPSPETVYNLPVDFYVRNNFTQSIYGANEVGINSTTITGLRYPTDFQLSLQSCPLTVWVGETDKDKFESTSDWVSIDKLTKVFDGQVFVDSERQVMEIAFSQPLEYHGGNLVVCFHKNDKDFFMHLNFYQDFDSRFIQHSLEVSNIDVNTPIDPATPDDGKLYDYVPVVELMTLPAKQGTVSGTITDTAGKPLEGAVVSASGTLLSDVTDTEGKFKLNLTVGNYTLKVSRPAYFDAEKQISIAENAITDAGKIRLTRLNGYKVSGCVTNQNGTPVAGASVSALGYFNYKTLTDADGRYVFDELLSADGKDYSLSVIASGYENLSKHVDIASGSTFDLELKNRLDRPYGVSATADAGIVTVNWDEPMREFRFDAPNVEIFDYLGYQGWAASVIGTAFPANLSLKEIQWFTTDKSGTEHETVNIVITELDEIGWPTRNVIKILQDIPNKDNEWSSYAFDTPIDCPYGFYVGLNYPYGNSNVDVCLSRPTEEYPVINGRFFACDDINFQSDERVRFADLAPYYNGNLLIRATGIDHGDVDYNDYSNEQPAKKAPVADCRFSVYRVHGEEWTMIGDDIDANSFTDTNSASLPAGEYVYAVAAKYPTGVSKYSLSAPLTLTGSGISDIEADRPEIVAIYSVEGRLLTNLPNHGVCIVHYSDGTCSKIIVK